MNPWSRWIRSLLSMPRWVAVGTIVSVSVASAVAITLLSLAAAGLPGDMHGVSVLIAVLVPTLVAGWPVPAARPGA
jgi:hypothetical protein